MRGRTRLVRRVCALAFGCFLRFDALPVLWVVPSYELLVRDVSLCAGVVVYPRPCALQHLVSLGSSLDVQADQPPVEVRGCTVCSSGLMSSVVSALMSET